MTTERILSHLPTVSEPSTPDFSGVWRNQLNSTMTLQISGSAVSGTYESTVSGSGGPITGTLAGYINGDLISFVVNWPAPSITAWVGQLTEERGRNVIRTLWQMTTNIPDAQEPTGMWHSIYSGADEFYR